VAAGKAKREREREREKEGERETERGRQGDRDRETGRQGEREGGREKESIVCFVGCLFRNEDVPHCHNVFRLGI